MSKYSEPVTVTGDIVQFNVGSLGGKVTNLSIPLSPIQSLNGYSNPWPAGGGKNVLPPPSSITVPTGLTVTDNNGMLTINGTTTGGTITIDIPEVEFAASGQKLSLLNGFTGGTIYFDYQGTQKDYFALTSANRVISGSSLSALQGQKIDRYRILINSQTLNNVTFGLMLLADSADATSFAPYENVCPISGRTGVSVYRTGKNLFEVNSSIAGTTNGCTISVASDGTITVSGTPSAKVSKSLHPSAFSGIGNLAMSMSGVPSGIRIYCKRVGASTSYPTLSNGSILETNIYTYDTFVLEVNTTYNGTATDIRVQVESGSPTSTYEPYQGTTYSLDWSSHGTVYGGTVDVTTGVLTVTGMAATKKLSTFSVVSTGTNCTHYRYFDPFFGAGNLPQEESTGNLCNVTVSAYNNNDTPHFYLNKTNGRVELWVPNGTDTSTDIQIYAPIATPQTVQLTAQQVELIKNAINNVWNNAGQTTLTYALMIKWTPAFSVNNVDFSNMVERDSYKTALIPVFGQTIQTLNGVGHTAMLRKKGRLTVKLNPQTDADTAAVCAELLSLPCEVLYHCLQRDLDVTALMTLDSVSAQFLSRCLYRGQKWNQTDDITLTEL